MTKKHPAPLENEDLESLYFFPDQQVSEAKLRWILTEGSQTERHWALSHLLRYAQWDDIWTYASREEVRQALPQLDLPGNLSKAWARMLKLEAPVS